MTTNYTAIINDNLDMFDETTIEETYEYSNGIGWDEADWHSDEEDDEVEETLRNYLKELRAQVATMTEGSDEWMETMAIYSDVYKDVYGHRPCGIGLRYHGAMA